jgi:hypothetical protein
MANPPAFGADAVIKKRMLELHRDGYVVTLHGQWALTEKGWRTLCAAAEPPMRKPTSLPHGGNSERKIEPKGDFPFGGQSI